MNRCTRVTSLLIASFLLLEGCPSPGVHSEKAGKPTVRVAFFSNITHAVALYSSAKGLFGKAVADSATVEERVFKAGPEEIEALFAGEVDFGYIGPGPAVNGYLKSKGEALRIIAGAASAGTALVVRKDVAITGVKDLAGKRVAVPQTGGTQDLSLRHALKTVGLSAKDKGGTVDVVQFAPADTLMLFQRGELDAAWLPEPWVARLENELGAKVVLEEKTLWPGGRFSTAVVIVRAEFLKAHPELVEKLLASHKSAVRAIQADPDAARLAIGEKLKTLTGKAIPDALLKSALSRTEITDDLLKESILTFADWSKDLGYLREGREALTGLFQD
ncbi:ABC transporter substrate-binding protein [Armatimonas sp.]|uniref:ABC transporter substrate-binding protein n=1 Tax=Armatimonas sp. TaxID=1872638 RepID=UPI0037517EF9